MCEECEKFDKPFILVFVHLPKDVISGFDRWWHSVFSFYVACQESEIILKSNHGIMGLINATPSHNCALLLMLQKRD